MKILHCSSTVLTGKMWKLLIFLCLFSQPIIGRKSAKCRIENRDCVFYSERIQRGDLIKILIDWNVSNMTIDQVLKVNFTDSTVEEIPNEILQTFFRLVDISAEKQGVQIINRKSLNFGEFLRQLHLPGNQIEVLEESCFVEASGLEYINFAENQIKDIHKDAFKGLANLNYLSLSVNQIEQLHENVFQHLVKLTQIYLNRNKLESVPNNLFETNVNLQIVYLSYNSILYIKPTMFSHLSHLNMLIVSRNNCTNDDWEKNANENFKEIEKSLMSCNLM